MQNAALKAKNAAVRNVADRAKFQYLPRSTLSDPKDPIDPPRRPASCRRAVPCPGFVPLAGNDWSAKRGNSRSRRRRPRKFASRSCAASSLSLNRGQRPPEAEKRARHFSGELVCAESAALAFGRRKPPALPPSRGKAAEECVSREARTNNHRRTRPAPKANAQVGQDGDFSRTMAFGAGGEAF